MAKTKRSNQLTRKDKKRMEEKNNQCTMKKPSNDRLPQSDGVRCICKITTDYGGRRFGCEILNTIGLDISILQKTWNLPKLNIETELKAKLKGTFRNNTRDRVITGNIVCVSYGDTIDFKYSNEESSYINSNLLVANKEAGEVSFEDESIVIEDELNEDEESVVVTKEPVVKMKEPVEETKESVVEDDINLDDI